MRTTEQAKRLIESLRPIQEKSTDGYVFPCPRCGHDRMNPKAIRNALSRRADVYICNQCGMDEAMMDMADMPPVPFNEWAMVKGFDSSDEEEYEDQEDED